MLVMQFCVLPANGDVPVKYKMVVGDAAGSVGDVFAWYSVSSLTMSSRSPQQCPRHHSLPIVYAWCILRAACCLFVAGCVRHAC